jgi:hypothetical protein
MYRVFFNLPTKTKKMIFNKNKHYKKIKAKKGEEITSWFVDSLVFQAPTCIGQEGGSTKLTKETRPTLM